MSLIAERYVALSLCIIMLMLNFCSQVNASFSLPAVLHRSISKKTEPTIGLSQAMLDVQHHVQQVEKLPSCKRIASKKLIHSCVSFDSLQIELPRDKEASLETFRNMFALRMTHCELGDANISMPQICNPLLDPEGDDEGLSGHLLTNCLHKLHATPSSWDSFNHAKTRGAIMCHAMRSEIDKDEQLQLFKLLFSTVSAVVTSVENSNSEFQKALDMMSELRTSMRDFYIKLSSENEIVHASIAKSWSEIEVRLQGDMSDITQDLQTMLQTVHEAGARLDTYVQGVEDEFRKNQEQNAELSISRQQQMLQFRQEVEARRDWLAYQTELALQNFTQGVYDVTRDLAVANELSADVAAGLRHHGFQLDSHIEQMNTLRESTAAFGAAEKERHGHLLHHFDEIAARTGETLEALQAASEYALQWEGAMKTIFGFVQGNLLILLAFYFLLFFLATLLFGLWAGVPCLVALLTATMVGSVLGTLFTFVMSPTRFLTSFAQSHPRLSGVLPLALLVATIFAAGMAFHAILTHSIRHRDEGQRRNTDFHTIAPRANHSLCSKWEPSTLRQGAYDF